MILPKNVKRMKKKYVEIIDNLIEIQVRRVFICTVRIDTKKMKSYTIYEIPFKYTDLCRYKPYSFYVSNIVILKLE